MPSQPEHRAFVIPGRFVAGEPLIDHDVETKAELDRLVATGVFTRSAKEAAEAAWSTSKPTPATDVNVKKPAAPAAAPAEQEA